MVDWDALEKAGHDLTHCGMLMAGTSLYYCENCGGFMLTRDGCVDVFHVHRGSWSTQDRCHSDVPTDTKTLKDKLRSLREADLERLKEI